MCHHHFDYLQMEHENHRLRQSLIPTTTTISAVNHSSTAAADAGESVNGTKTTLTNASIILRLILVIFVGLVSLWANHEASKGFTITVVNDAGETFSGKRFDLFFVSNDEATRLILKTSEFVENFLYSSENSQPQNKKLVKHVILRLSRRNMTIPATVEPRRDDAYVIHVSPSILNGRNYKHDMFLALQLSMARIWLWDGQGQTPESLVNGIAEYITNLASSGSSVTSYSGGDLPASSGRSCWKSLDSRTVAEFLNYCDRRREGSVRRLNQAMANGWHERMLDDVLEIPAWHLCQSYNFSRNFGAIS